MGNLANLTEGAVLLGDWEVARSGLAGLDAIEIPESSWHFLYRELTRSLLIALTEDLTEGLRLSDLVADAVAASENLPLRATHLWERALMHLLSGETATALAEAVASFQTDPTGINAAEALRIKARAASWLHDTEGARSALAAMEAMRGRVMAAARETVAAGVAALEHRIPESLTHYQAAVRGWKELDSPLQLAFCWIDMSKLLDPQTEANDAANLAHDLLDRVGATPMLTLVTRATEDAI